ncbi:hypothetical protein LguiB_013673 [Lonicera macranthoides]
MVPSISKLPEGCISDILSRTSPWDVCRSSAISTGFKSAADSDAVWHRFLPSDYPEILARSDSPVVCTTKKQLYFLLCDSLILLDGGKLRFMLDKRSGKKCYMIPSRELSIAWKDDDIYWNWPSIFESRFTDVANLRFVCWLDISGKIQTRMLSPVTNYAAYLVYKVSPSIRDHIGPVKVSVRFLGDEVEPEIAVVNLKQHGNMRTDGWMEIELGEFFSDHGDGGEVEMQLKETEILNGKYGLIVEGIEVRPKETVTDRVMLSQFSSHVHEFYTLPLAQLSWQFSCVTKRSMAFQPGELGWGCTRS